MIYFARLPDQTIKIGCTRWLAGRMRQLEWINKCHVCLLGVLPGLLQEEREIHARFSMFRTSGCERFCDCHELREFISTQICPSPPNRWWIGKSTNIAKVSIDIRHRLAIQPPQPAA